MNAQQMIQRGERPTEEMEKDLDALLGQVQSQAAYQRLVVGAGELRQADGARERLDRGRDREGRDELDHHARLASVASAGRLIVFEGGEGTGKSTQLRRLADLLDRARHRVIARCASPAARRSGRKSGASCSHVEDEIEPRAEALLFMASRAQLVAREIRPALERGEWVLLDRFFLEHVRVPDRRARAAGSRGPGGESLRHGRTGARSHAAAHAAGAGGARRGRRGGPRHTTGSRRRGRRSTIASPRRSRRSRGRSGRPDTRSAVRSSPSMRGEASRTLLRECSASVLAQWPGTFPDFTASDHR